jgi:hypothetical protein
MTGNNTPVFLPQKRAFPYRRKPLRSLYEKNFLSPYTLSLLRGYKEQKAKTTLKIVRRKIKWIS